LVVDGWMHLQSLPPAHPSTWKLLKYTICNSFFQSSQQLPCCMCPL
jgi:hypothetical protein